MTLVVPGFGRAFWPLIAILVAIVAVGGSRCFSVQPTHRPLRVVERLVDRIAPGPDPLPATAAYRWSAAEIDRQWSRAARADGVLLKSPALTVDESADAFESIAVTLPPSRERLILLWNDAPTFARSDLLRNRRELFPVPTGPTRVVVRVEDIRAGSHTPIRHLFLSLPPALRTSEVIGGVEVFVRSERLRERAGRTRWSIDGHRRDAILTPAGESLEVATDVPRDATLAVGVRARGRSSSATGRLSVATQGVVTTLFEAGVTGGRWQELRLPVRAAGGSRFRFEVTAGEDAVVWSSPSLLVNESADDRPNVILYVVDALRADRLGLYGARVSRSPFLDELGRDSVVFQRAYAAASWTKPSVTSLLTSRHPQTHMLGARLYTDSLPESVPTLQDLLRAAGYVTAQFSGNPLSAALSNLDQGFDEAFGPEAFGGPLAPKVTAEMVNEKLLPWLDAHRGDRFFLYVQSMDPHGPLETGDDPYGAGIAAADREIRRLYGRLTALGLNRNTLLIVTSDHGEAFGEHGRTGHGQSVYEEEIRIPLLIHQAGTVRSTRIEDPVSSIDLLPTILDVCGVMYDRREIQGISRSLTGAAHERRPIFSTSFVYPEDTDISDPNRVQATTVIEFPWKLIVTAGQKADEPRIELYDLGADPGERRNLVLQERIRVDALRARLRTFLADQEEARRRFASRYGQDRTPRALGGDLLERLRALGYVR